MRAERDTIPPPPVAHIVWELCDGCDEPLAACDCDNRDTLPEEQRRTLEP